MFFSSKNQSEGAAIKKKSEVNKVMKKVKVMNRMMMKKMKNIEQQHCNQINFQVVQ